MVQNEHWNGQPRPRSKSLERFAAFSVRVQQRCRRQPGSGGSPSRCPADRPCSYTTASECRHGHRAAADRGRPSSASPPANMVMPLSMAFWIFGRNDRQHRQATGDVEAAQRDRIAFVFRKGCARSSGARELVGLHADQADQRLAAAALDIGHDPGRDEPGQFSTSSIVVMTISPMSGPKHPAPLAIVTQAIECGQGIGRDNRAQPGDRVAFVVIMRGLDQHEMERRSLALPRRQPFGPGSKRARAAAVVLAIIRSIPCFGKGAQAPGIKPGAASSLPSSRVLRRGRSGSQLPRGRPQG